MIRNVNNNLCTDLFKTIKFIMFVIISHNCIFGDIVYAIDDVIKSLMKSIGFILKSLLKIWTKLCTVIIPTKGMKLDNEIKLLLYKRYIVREAWRRSIKLLSDLNKPSNNLPNDKNPCGPSQGIQIRDIASILNSCNIVWYSSTFDGKIDDLYEDINPGVDISIDNLFANEYKVDSKSKFGNVEGDWKFNKILLNESLG